MTQASVRWVAVCSEPALVQHLMIDKVSGQVEYAVMSTGGFLGIGENYSPVPWDSLVYERRG